MARILRYENLPHLFLSRWLFFQFFFVSYRYIIFYASVLVLESPAPVPLPRVFIVTNFMILFRAIKKNYAVAGWKKEGLCRRKNRFCTRSKLERNKLVMSFARSKNCRWKKIFLDISNFRFKMNQVLFKKTIMKIIFILKSCIFSHIIYFIVLHTNSRSVTYKREILDRVLNHISYAYTNIKCMCVSVWACDVGRFFWNFS